MNTDQVTQEDACLSPRDGGINQSALFKDLASGLTLPRTSAQPLHSEHKTPGLQLKWAAPGIWGSRGLGGSLDAQGPEEAQPDSRCEPRPLSWPSQETPEGLHTREGRTSSCPGFRSPCQVPPLCCSTMPVAESGGHGPWSPGRESFLNQWLCSLQSDRQFFRTRGSTQLQAAQARQSSEQPRPAGVSMLEPHG